MSEQVRSIVAARADATVEQRLAAGWVQQLHINVQPDGYAFNSLGEKVGVGVPGHLGPAPLPAGGWRYVGPVQLGDSAALLYLRWLCPVQE